MSKHFIGVVKEMRPQHYMKNLLIFSAVIFSGNLFQAELFLRCLYGFASFSLLASAIYIMNDIHDYESDRKHPVKCKRPIASGTISILEGYVVCFSLLVLSFAVNLIPGFSIGKFLVWGSYLLINILYSFGLKGYAFIDIILLMLCYVLRLTYGAVIVDIPISSYLYLTVFTLSFFLGMGKRKNELKLHGGSYRQSLRAYSYEFLDRFMYVCCALSIAFYALWCISNDEKNGNVMYTWTVPLVIIILMKYTHDIETDDSEGDPVSVIIKDRFLMICVTILAGLIFYILYMQWIS